LPLTFIVVQISCFENAKLVFLFIIAKFVRVENCFVFFLSP